MPHDETQYPVYTAHEKCISSDIVDGSFVKTRRKSVKPVETVAVWGVRCCGPASLITGASRASSKRQGRVNDLKHLIAGAMSAVLSKTATAPFERLKMEMQLRQRTNSVLVAKELLTSAGFLTFWKGNGMNLVRVTPHKAVNFYCYSLYKTYARRFCGGRGPAGLDKFIAGAMAGSTATLLCFPLDVIRTRMLSEEGGVYSTARGTILKMLNEESLASFYVGCLPAVCSTAASGAIFYSVYDLLKEQHLRRRQQKTGREEKDLTAARTLLFGALAGATAESILYPLEVLRRRMQVYSMSSRGMMLEAQCKRGALTAAAEQKALANGGLAAISSFRALILSAIQRPKFKQALLTAAQIYKVDGSSGFYQGFVPHIMQVLPSAALSYYFYEASKRLLSVIDHA